MSLGIILALCAFALATGVVVWTNAVAPLTPSVERAMVGVAGLIATGALLLHPGAVGYAVGGLALVVASFLFLLTFMSGLPRQRAAVAVGQKAPDFQSFDAEGKEFRLSDLAGAYVLLKFFRGTWCPYCVADLKRWSESRADLDALGIHLVAVSHDSVEELKQFKRKRNWKMTLVADPSLEIIRRYNLQNRNFTPKRGPFRDMAIPAAILIGGDGIVLWMQQATDFRIRSQPEAVLAEIWPLIDADSPHSRVARARRIRELTGTYQGKEQRIVFGCHR